MKKILIFTFLILLNVSLMAEDKPNSEPVLVSTDMFSRIVNIDIKPTKEKILFRLYDEGGKDLTEYIYYLKNSENKKQIDLSGLRPGTYFIWYHADDAYRVNKLIIT